MIICRRWYRFYAPAKFVHRRNIGQVKVADSLILALLIWQAKTELDHKEGSANIGYKATKKIYYFNQGLFQD